MAPTAHESSDLAFWGSWPSFGKALAQLEKWHLDKLRVRLLSGACLMLTRGVGFSWESRCSKPSLGSPTCGRVWGVFVIIKLEKHVLVQFYHVSTTAAQREDVSSRSSCQGCTWTSRPKSEGAGFHFWLPQSCFHGTHLPSSLQIPHSKSPS